MTMSVLRPSAYAFMAVFLLSLSAVWAQDFVDPKMIDTMEQEQKQAAKRQEELEAEAEKAAIDILGLQEQMAKTAGEAQNLEREASDAESHLKILDVEENRLSRQWTQHREALADLLAALQRLEASRPPALAVHPKEAVEAARSAGLMAEISPLLKKRAENLKQNLKDMARVRKDILRSQKELLKVEEDIKTRRKKLSRFLEEKKKLETQLRHDAQKEAARAEELAKKAKTLSELIESLKAAAGDVLPRLKPAVPRPEQMPRPTMKPRKPVRPRVLRAPFKPLTGRFADMRGRLRLPAAGYITRAFGASMASGGRTKGIKLKTRPRAQVVAPFRARVEFAGKFGNYGRLLILNVGDGYHLVVSGLERLVAQTGGTVLAGEPLGEMGNTNKPSPELYFEIRKNGKPVNPAPWMRGPRPSG